MTEHCSNIQCYCGTAAIADCETPLGPCVAPIEAAAGSSDLAAVGNALTDPNHAVNLANAVGDCAKQNCAADCGL